MKSIFQIEFLINVAPSILYPRLSTPGGLVEWFADDISASENVFTFIWNGSKHEAFILHRKQDNYIRFKWAEDQDNQCYFEFKINRDELTGDVAIIITDFAEEDEKNDIARLWETQIGRLKNALGVT